MPSMFNHDRQNGWTTLASDDDGSDLDELAQFIAENDSETSLSVSEPLHIRVCSGVTSMCKCVSNGLRRCKTLTCGVVLSVFLIVATTVICVGLGVTSMIPLPVIDISIEAFNIPNHIVYKRYNSFTQALKHNASIHPGRSKRNALELTGAQYQHHSGDNQDRGSSNNILRESDMNEERLQYKSFNDLRNEEVDRIVSKMEEDVHGQRFKRHSHSGCIFGYQAYPRWKMQVIFLAQGDNNPNMFTKERLKHVHHVEKMITSHPQFQQFCLKDYHLGQKDPAVLAQDNCAPLNSLLTYFYPTKDKSGKIYYDGLGNNLDQVDSALKLAMNHETFYYYVDEKINKTYRHSKLLRTEVIFGAPLEGYCVRAGRKEQEELFKKFIITYIDVLGKASTQKVQVLYGGNELFDYEVDATFWRDVRMAYFTLGFIILLMFILTSFSIWLTVWGMLSILLSFPLALFFYRTVFHINALGILNGAAAFVIIGIGVDDVFVFVNIFRQASHLKVHADRIKYTIKTAGKATFFTSFTTAAAFAANIASSIPAVKEFGLFMSLIVSSCWMTVIMIMPSALYLWVLCFAKCEAACFKFCRCCMSRRGEDPIDAQQLHQGPSVISTSLDDDVPMLNIDNSSPSGNSIADDDGDIPMLIPDPYTVGSGPASMTSLDKADGFYLGTALQTLIGKYLAKVIVKGRWFIIAFFGLLLVGSMGLMTQLRPATRPPQLFNPNTNLQKLLDLKANFSVIQSLSCYKCSALYKVTPTNPNAETTTMKSLPHLPPTTPRPKPFTTAHPMQPMTSLAKVTTSKTTTTRTTTTKSTPSTTTRRIHMKPVTQQPNHETPKPSSVDEDFNACNGQSCNNLKDRPNLRIGTKVFVVFGIKGLDRSGVQMGHVLSDQGRTVFDPEFSKQSNTLPFLKDLCRVCKLIAANQELVKKGSARCLPPLIPKMFLMLLKNVPECQDLPNSNDHSAVSLQAPISAVGGMNSSHSLLWLAFAFESTTSEGLSYFAAYKQYQKWEAFIEHIKTNELKPDSPLQDMFQASEFWKKVMMEVVAVSSAIYGLALSLVVCIIAIAIFTGHIGLLFIVVITIIAMICLVVAIFYVAGWEMGAVEAISLSILVGSSVDYCVHLVEGYLIAFKYVPQNTDMKNSSMREWRTSFALRHIGVAIISSAITTIIAAIPLTQTTIQPFAKFGAIVLINTSVSIVFTLLLCGALLTTIGPAKFKSSLKSSGIALVITGVVVGILTLVLFIISRTVMDIPGPGGDPLFPR